MKEGVQVIDTRGNYVFLEGFVPGSLNIDMTGNYYLIIS